MIVVTQDTAHHHQVEYVVTGDYVYAPLSAVHFYTGGIALFMLPSWLMSVYPGAQCEIEEVVDFRTGCYVLMDREIE